VKQGDFISIDGGTARSCWRCSSGESTVIQGLRGNKKAQKDPMFVYFSRLMEWADRARRLGVRTNADTPEDSTLAIALGAEGIGLTRTEHMFFGEDRILSFRKMILAETAEQRAKIANKELLPHSERTSRASSRPWMASLSSSDSSTRPCTSSCRGRGRVAQVAEATGKSAAEIMELTAALHESNPMLGHRGCRLGSPSRDLRDAGPRHLRGRLRPQEEGYSPIPEVMIPLVSLQGELEICFEYTNRVAQESWRRRESRSTT